MELKQLFYKPSPPNNGFSVIYPKSDWYWYYMNNDWKEVAFWAIVGWWDIVGDVTQQTDLINYIAGIRYYPKDYVSPTETIVIKEFENYAVYNPLVNDGIIINDWTIIVN